MAKPIAQQQDNLSLQEVHVDECCICLFAIAPFQALFVAPCSHTFHYKCLRPLLDRYPGFICPLCRSYADLDANVDVEVAEVWHFFYMNVVYIYVWHSISFSPRLKIWWDSKTIQNLFFFFTHLNQK